MGPNRENRCPDTRYQQDPKWLKKKELGHIGSNEEAREPGAARRDSSIDLDFEECVFNVNDGALQHEQVIGQASCLSSHPLNLCQSYTCCRSSGSLYCL